MYLQQNENKKYIAKTMNGYNKIKQQYDILLICYIAIRSGKMVCFTLLSLYVFKFLKPLNTCAGGHDNTYHNNKSFLRKFANKRRLF